jgi:pentatricopeptide repeat protein
VDFDNDDEDDEDVILGLGSRTSESAGRRIRRRRQRTFTADATTSTSSTTATAATAYASSKTSPPIPMTSPPTSSGNVDVVVPYESWLDRTTARILSLDDDYDDDDYADADEDGSIDGDEYRTRRPLTSDDVDLITSLMASHARRGTVNSAVTCERLLRRVVMEVDMNGGNGSGNGVGNVHDDDDDDDDDDDEDDEGVRVTTKMYTVAMDAWAKSQRRPPFLFGGIGGGGGRGMGRSSRGRDADGGGAFGFEGKRQKPQQRQQQQREISHERRRRSYDEGDDNEDDGDEDDDDERDRRLGGSGEDRQRQPKMPLGAAAQRAHRIHMSLVETHARTGDVHLAPSTISYNAAINAWSKSYHPSSGEMAELLLGEMMHEWKHGNGGRGNERVKPDVVTFTAVIDAWVKCTALAAQDYRHNNHKDDATASSSSSPSSSSPPSTSSSGIASSASSSQQQQKAARSDEITRRAAMRAKEILMLMIRLGHYDPSLSTSASKVEPGMRPNCYTYSAVMNALAKSCCSSSPTPESSASSSSSPTPPQRRERVVGGVGRGQQKRRQGQEQRYDPASEAQEMLEDMIIKHRRYKERVGIGGRGTLGTSTGVGYYGGTARFEKGEAVENYEEESSEGEESGTSIGKGTADNKYTEWIKGSWSTSSLSSMSSDKDEEIENETRSEGNKSDNDDRHWYEPRPDELTFPPNTINYNSVLNAWSRASRYDSHAALRAEEILLKRMEAPFVSSSSPSFLQVADEDRRDLDVGHMGPGGDDVYPDALSYSLVIHAWLRGCRGIGSSFNAHDTDGNNSSKGAMTWESGRQNGINSKRKVAEFTDLDRIERAMKILDRLEAWARKDALNHRRRTSRKWRPEEGTGGYIENEYKGDDVRGKAEDTSSVIVDDEVDLDGDIDDEDMTVDDEDVFNPDDATPEDGDDSNRDYENRKESFDRGYRIASSPSHAAFRQHDKAHDLDVEVYNSILVAYSREQQSNVDHAATVMRLLDRMENLAVELDMPSVSPNQRSYNIALSVITNSAARLDTSLAGYYNDKHSHKSYLDDEGKQDTILSESGLVKVSKKKKSRLFNPLYAGMAAESILSKMLSQNHRPDAYTFASVLNTYQRIPNGKLESALAADAVVRGMESLHLHGRIDDPPDVYHYTMVCACWSRSGGEHQNGAGPDVVNPGERCSEILRHMQQRHLDGFPRVKPNIRTYNAVIDSFAYNGRLEEAESMLFSMVDNFESSAMRSMLEGIEDTELPVRPDSFSFNTVIQQWARGRTPDGGRRAELVLDRMLEFHHNGNADVRPDERSFAYIIYHYTKGAGRMEAKAPDRALKLLRRMIKMYREGYKELLPSYHNKTNPIFAFTSVIDAHSILRRPDSGSVGDELFNAMMLLGKNINALSPNTYACLSVFYAWSSCGSVDAGKRATELLSRMEDDMIEAAKRGEESRMRTTQRCYILAQTAWARSPSERKAEGAFEVLEMMENNYASGNKDARPTVQAYSMVSLTTCVCRIIFFDLSRYD